VNEKRARTSLRFSLLKTVTAEDVDYVVSVVPQAVERLRAVSPVEAGTLG
jgi:cysteine desulfurase